METVDSNTAETAQTKLVRKPRAGDPRYGRSRVGNGNAFLPGVDGRTVWSRRARDIVSDLSDDLGGVDNISAAERSIIRRVAILSVELERMEATFATSPQADASAIDIYMRAAGNLRRLLESLGPRRRAAAEEPPEVSPFADYLKRKIPT
jgi:hypothetical protein